MRLLATFIVIVSIFGYSNIAFAQFDNVSAERLREDALSISIIPANPKPREQVFLDISGVSVDLNASKIEWFLNDSKVSGGVGNKTITTTAPDTGKTLRVQVVITDTDGKIYKKNTELNSASVSLIWEARSYTPPMFQGRAMPTRGSTIVVQAVPDFKNSAGEIIQPSNLVYLWKKDGNTVQEVSGFGKNVFIFKNDSYIRDALVEVEVRSLDKKWYSTQKTYIERVSPQFFFYKYSPLNGTDFSMSSKDFTGSNEIGVRVVPYFTPIDSSYRFKATDLNWSLSGKTIDTRGLPFLIIQNSEKGSARGNLSVSVKKPGSFEEDVLQSVGLQFK